MHKPKLCPHCGHPLDNIVERLENIYYDPAAKRFVETWHDQPPPESRRSYRCARCGHSLDIKEPREIITEKENG
jgi:rRNA maturation endonuclease Nob1